MKKETTVHAIEATIETTEVVVVSRGRARRAWCRNCRRQVRMVRPQQAARLARVSERAIYRAIDDGRAGYIEDARWGAVRVCLDDVMRALAADRCDNDITSEVQEK